MNKMVEIVRVSDKKFRLAIEEDLLYRGDLNPYNDITTKYVSYKDIYYSLKNNRSFAIFTSIVNLNKLKW